MNISLQERHKKIKTLPLPIRKIVADFDTPLKVEEVGKKANLHIDQTGELSDEVALTLLGFTKREDFLNNIKNRLKIDQVTAENITRDLDTKIFAPIKDELKKAEEKQPEISKPKDISTDQPLIQKEVPRDNPTSDQIPIPNYTGSRGSNDFQKEDWKEVENRDVLMQEIESPSVSPFRINDLNNNKPENQSGAPENIPSNIHPQDHEKSSLFKPPIIRTMKSDMEDPEKRDTNTQTTGPAPHSLLDPRSFSEGGGEVENDTNENITDTNDSQRSQTGEKIPNKINIVPQNLPIMNQVPVIMRGKFGHGNIPIPKPQINPSPVEIPKPQINKIPDTPPANLPTDNFNQKIQIPAIKKSYVVDPYREATE